METRQFIVELVPAIARNASVARIEETGGGYRVTIVGTTGIEARCEVSRDAADAATTRDDARARVAGVLKACADRTVAEVPDGRG